MEVAVITVLSIVAITYTPKPCVARPKVSERAAWHREKCLTSVPQQTGNETAQDYQKGMEAEQAYIHRSCLKPCL